MNFELQWMTESVAENILYRCDHLLQFHRIMNKEHLQLIKKMNRLALNYKDKIMVLKSTNNKIRLYNKCVTVYKEKGVVYSSYDKQRLNYFYHIYMGMPHKRTSAWT